MFDIFCIHFIAISAVVFVTILSVGNFDPLSTAAELYASLISSSDKSQAKSKCTSSFGLTTGSNWNDCDFLNAGLKFLPGSV